MRTCQQLRLMRRKSSAIIVRFRTSGGRVIEIPCATSREAALVREKLRPIGLKRRPPPQQD